VLDVPGAVAFMTMTGIDLALYFTAWRGRAPAAYLRDPEARNSVLVLVLAVPAPATPTFLCR
jgi:hypothetical protein